ncbi:MAG TPA: MFS transporter [Verrucomicrobiae bacterium]|nr:MFS transporter [Verrucomicrobiae bacterium]
MGELTSAPANPRPTKARFLVLAWLCAAAALAYLSRNAIAVAESTVRRDLGLTKQQSGWLMSGFFFSYALLSIPAAQFGQRTGSRRALPLLATVWSIATAATALVSGLGGFLAARIVQGVAQAGLFPTTTVTIAKWFPLTGRAFAVGALGSFMSLGGALCAWLTGVLLEAFEPRLAAGWNWRLTFLLFSVPGIVWALCFWWWFRDEPGEHRAVNEAELEVIQADHTARAERAQPPTRGTTAVLPTPWLPLFSSPAMWWLCGQQLFRAAGYIFFTSWFATYLQETRGVGIAHSGFLNMLPLIAVVAAGMVGGALSDWLLKRTASRNVARRWLSMLSQFACAGLIFWALVLEDALTAVLVISAGSFFASLASPCAYAMTIDMGGSHVATVNATMNMMGNFGAWAFPIAVPWLLARFGNWDAVLVVFGGLYVIGALFWLLLKPEGTIVEQALCRENLNRSHAPVFHH